MNFNSEKLIKTIVENTKIAVKRTITFLGTGPAKPITTKHGKSNRRNTSTLIQYKDKRYLIDIPPDFDQKITFDYLLTTHHHTDAFGGFDNIIDRDFVYAAPSSLLKNLKKIKGKYKKQTLKMNSKNTLGDLSVIPFSVEHAYSSKYPTFGYQFIFNNSYKITYASDMVVIPKASEKYFSGVDMVIADGAGWERNLPTHFGVLSFLDLIEEKKWDIGKIFFVQIGRQVPEYQKAQKTLKKKRPKTNLAWDGLTINF